MSYMDDPKLTPLVPDFSWKVPLQQIEIAALHAALAAANQRIQELEAALAAVPVEAIRRCFAPDGELEWAADTDTVWAWLGAQPEVQP